MTPLTVQAPTDAQLVFIWKLCADYHVDRPDVVASKAEASEIIDAIRAGTYDPGRYAWPFYLSDETIPF